MIELTNTNIQTVIVGANVLYNTKRIHSGCAERHTHGSSQISLTAPGRYLVTFSGNIAVPTGQTVGEVSLGIAENSEIINGTIMRATPAAVEEYFTVSAQTYVDVEKNCCGGVCCKTISVENNSTIPVNVDNPNFTAVRVNGR